jgi:hypothetical protein
VRVIPRVIFIVPVRALYSMYLISIVSSQLTPIQAGWAAAIETASEALCGVIGVDMPPARRQPLAARS